MSLIQSLKSRHYNVAATITEFFLLKLIILGSTALFVVKNIEINTIVNATFTDTFDATDAWSNHHFLKTYSLPYRFPTPCVYGGGLYRSVWTYLGKPNNLTTMDEQWELPDGIAASRFTVSDAQTNIAKLKASIDVFVLEISCEPATLSIHPKVVGDYDDVDIQLTSEFC